MDLDLIIFDKDGTLIDVHYYWVGMLHFRSEMLAKKYIKSGDQFTATNELMSNMGINPETGKIKPTGPVGIKPREFIIDIAYQVVKKYCSTIKIEQVSSVFKEIDVYSQKHLKQLVRPLPGAFELLKILKQKKIKIAIATTDITSRAKLAMDHIEMTHYFDCIAGSDLVEKAKPSPDLVNYLCNKTACEKNKTVVVGDSIVDLKMAESAKVGFIGVKTGLYSPEFLLNSQTLVEDFNSLKELV